MTPSIDHRPSLADRSLTSGYREVGALRREFAAKEQPIRERLSEFRRIGEGTDRELFPELCFCLLAIQTKARSSDDAVRALIREGLLWSGNARSIARSLHHRVRFHNHKAAYVVAARNRWFSPGGAGFRSAMDVFLNPVETRSWLVDEIEGLGLKEASHFLRNIGRGEDLAILDRHVLDNLLRHRVIGRLPTSLTPRRYLKIEARMRVFAAAVRIPVAALDLLFWSRETGEIFK